MKTYPPTSPPTRLETWLLGLDADHFAALVIAFVVGLFVLGMVVSIVARLGKTEASERRDRTGAEANVAAFERLGREANR